MRVWVALVEPIEANEMATVFSARIVDGIFINKERLEANEAKTTR